VLRRRSDSDAEDANEGTERQRPGPQGPGNGAYPRRHPQRDPRQSTIISAITKRDARLLGRDRGPRQSTITCAISSTSWAKPATKPLGQRA
jgi:hypothetical protein